MLLSGIKLLFAYRIIAQHSTAIEALGSKQIMAANGWASWTSWAYVSRVGSAKFLDAVTRLSAESAVAGLMIAQFVVGCVLAVTFTATDRKLD